ncbi:unnamed protein product [Rotaria sp. Silwood1]|nr:unnamed protein product [Rotaria sp. Silwood1]CAF1133213.1 unnamed protein product [Rotaria sp. Silwood1]CAF1215801.1 unnamed protein product [Rotaria sp. Silwood1]CAF3450892.1 unnamed protein product [Rotaria sp. Silwood1]CAF3451845.1 unnamed protein product [Rotaria sp. Silwood1]
MPAHQRPLSYIYTTTPYTIPAYGTVSTQPILLNVNWYSSWPSIGSIIISVTMVIFSSTIIGLDIANIAIEGNKQNGTSKLGLGTATVGAGIWSGSISFLAAIFIIAIIFIQNKRVAATSALLAVTLAFLFTIVLVGLAGNSVQNNLSKTDRTNVEKVQDKLLIAILSLAVLVMILCMIFFIMYTKVLFSSSTQKLIMR